MKFKYSFCYVLYSPRASIWSSLYCSMTIVSIFRGGGFGNLAGWYSYFFGTIIRHTRVCVKNLYVSIDQFWQTEDSDLPKTPPFKKRQGSQDKESEELWNKSVTSFEDKLCFYLPQLMPPIQLDRVVAGSKLKSVTDIPGRRRTIESNPIVQQLEVCQMSV